MGVESDVEQKELAIARHDYQELKQIQANIHDTSKEVEVLLNHNKSRLNDLSALFEETILKENDFIVLSKRDVFLSDDVGLAKPRFLNSKTTSFQAAIDILYTSIEDPVLDWKNDNWFCVLFAEEEYIVDFVAEVAEPSKVNYCYPLAKIGDGEKLIKSDKNVPIGVNFVVNRKVYGFVLDHEFVVGQLRANQISDVDLFLGYKLFKDLAKELTESLNITKLSIEEANEHSTSLINERVNKMAQSLSIYDSQLKDRQRLAENISQEKEYLESIKADETKTKKSLENVRNEHSDLSKQNFELDTLKNLRSEELDQSRVILVDLQENLAGIEQDIKGKQSELDNVKERISKETAEGDTFTNDLSGHMKESRIQLGCYLLLALTLIGVTSVIFWEVYERANLLIGSFNTAQDTNIWQLLLSRSPLIIASTVLLTGFLALLYFTVNHIISLNKDRMNMLKASVLAEQISVSLAHDFDLTRDQRLEQSKKLKVDIIMKLFESQQPASKLDAKNMSVMTQAIDTVLKVKKQTK